MDPQVARDSCRGRLIFGIHGELLWRNFCQRANNRGTAARSILIEVQANLSRAAFGWGFVGLAFENCGANRQSRFHRRILTALRCANKYSASANASAESASRTNTWPEIVCTLKHFTKAAVERPPRRRAQPAVGKT